MAPDSAVAESVAVAARSSSRFLYVAWQNRENRRIVPVGRLALPRAGEHQVFEFRYLARARQVLARPFTSFPDFNSRYQSEHLFPFFENRMVPAGSADFTGVASCLGLPDDANPFEVLASSGGLRATDTVEVFSEPYLNRVAGQAAVRFLVRGVRHQPGAHDKIDDLQVGDSLVLQPEPGNETDQLAVLVLASVGVPVGWVPAYLCPCLHRSASASARGWSDMVVTVRHIGGRSGPAHFRLLCDLSFPWPFPEGPFETDEFAVET